MIAALLGLQLSQEPCVLDRVQQLELVAGILRVGEQYALRRAAIGFPLQAENRARLTRRPVEVIEDRPILSTHTKVYINWRGFLGGRPGSKQGVNLYPSVIVSKNIDGGKFGWFPSQAFGKFCDRLFAAANDAIGFNQLDSAVSISSDGVAPIEESYLEPGVIFVTDDLPILVGCRPDLDPRTVFRGHGFARQFISLSRPLQTSLPLPDRKCQRAEAEQADERGSFRPPCRVTSGVCGLPLSATTGYRMSRLLIQTRWSVGTSPSVKFAEPKKASLTKTMSNHP